MLKDLITGVVVNYNTPDLLVKAIESINKFHDIQIIVIEGSPSPEEINYPNVTVKNVGYNIGHGLGMDMGIKLAETDYVLTFDTDIEMKEPCLELMLGEMKEDTYSVGKMYFINNAYFYQRNRHIFPNCSIARMIHPSFQLLKKESYFQYAPCISDGAPTVLSYHDIMMRGKEKEVLIDFPVLDYVDHRNAGTRDRLHKEDWEYSKPNNPTWLEKWILYKQGKMV